nr:hypothetical protein [Escherichia coli]
MFPIDRWANSHNKVGGFPEITLIYDFKSMSYIALKDFKKIKIYKIPFKNMPVDMCISSLQRRFAARSTLRTAKTSFAVLHGSCFNPSMAPAPSRHHRGPRCCRTGPHPQIK